MRKEPPVLHPLSVGVADAAKALGVSKSFLYKLVAEGKLKTIHIGKRHIVPVSEMHAFLERCGR